MSPQLRVLIDDAHLLLKLVPGFKHQFSDYSFIVFPAAKAYEGFLKMAFLKLGFITREDYASRRFRIGKALNPSLDSRFRNKESVYDKLVDFCNGEHHLADKLWETWSLSRNLLFHWFPGERGSISLAEARERLLMITSAMDEMYAGCNINSRQ